MTSPSTSKKTSRSRAFFIFGILIVIAGILYFTWWFIYARHYETTEDAYTNANITQINSQIEGHIVQIYADNTQFVHQGMLLLELDSADAQSKLDAAEAHLAQTVRNLQKDRTQNHVLEATIQKVKADIERLTIQAQQASVDLKRRESLVQDGSVSQEEVSSTRKNYLSLQAEVKAMQADLMAQREQLKANQNLTATATIADHPSVKSAIAELTKAYKDLERTKIYAPVDGLIAKRTAQIGQHVTPTTPLLTLVPNTDRWIDANFKETQISSMSIGQPAKVFIDMYGDKVVFNGKVLGVSPGSGGSFALIPPQNASGNWIKVVQRVPVRISIDPTEHANFPLATGLSATVTVDVSEKTGSLFPKVNENPVPVLAPTEPSVEVSELQRLIDHIIRINS